MVQNLSIICLFALALIFHWADAFFTYKLIERDRKRFSNPEELEMNPMHNHFFKKYGMKNGMLRSVAISSTFICIAGFVLGFILSLYMFMFLLGALFMIASINGLSYFSGSIIDSKLQFSDEYKAYLRKKICPDCKVLSGKDAEKFYSEINSGEISPEQQKFLDDCKKKLEKREESDVKTN